MKYIHVKNIEKYHPGYKDRQLLWAKIGIGMASGDPDFEMIESEIDKWRFVCFVLLELKAKKPLPLSEDYFTRKGFDLKKRPISLTIQMLHNFLDIVNSDVEDSTKVPLLSSILNTSNTTDLNTKNKEEKEPKIKFSEFVVMTQGQYDQLAQKLGKTVLDQYVERLNNYIGSHGKRYKSHYHTILNWHGRDGGTKPPVLQSANEREQWRKSAYKNCSNCRGDGFIYAPGSGKYAKCRCVNG